MFIKQLVKSAVFLVFGYGVGKGGEGKGGKGKKGRRGGRDPGR